MKATKSKVLAFVMCVLMVLSIIPATAAQAFAGEDVPEKKVTITRVIYTNDPLRPTAVIHFMASHIYSGCPIAYIDPMIGRSYGGYEYELDTQDAANLPTGWSLNQDSETNEWQLLCSPLHLTGGIGAPQEGEEIWVGADVTSSDWVNDFDQLQVTVPKEGESVTVTREPTINAATITNVFIKSDGRPAPAPVGVETEWTYMWDKSEATSVVQAIPYAGYSVSPSSHTVSNGDMVTFTYVQAPLEDPQNVKVKVVSMEEGTMKLEGGAAEITGKVATLEVSFDKAGTPESYWVGTLKTDGDNWTKMGSGTMPFVIKKDDPAPAHFEFEEGEGANGEKVTETETRIIVEKKVVKRDETTGHEFLDQEAYKTGDDIIVRVLSERGKYENYESSKEVDIEIPFEEFMVGKEVSTGEKWCVATILKVGEDENGLPGTELPEGVEPSSPVHWISCNGENLTYTYTPEPVAGYSITPGSAVLKDGDEVTFVYKKIKESNNLSSAVVTYPEGKDENSEYEELDLDQLGLKWSFNGKALKKNEDYKKEITTKTDEETGREVWDIKFIPVEPNTTGDPIQITLKKPEKEVITSVTLDHTSFVYNGEIQRANVTKVYSGEKLLSGSDYTVKYSLKNSTWAGTYTITVTGTGNYAGTKEAAYEIEPAPVTDATLSETRYTYNRKIQKPSLTSVKSNNTTLTTNDYDAVYSNPNSRNKGEYTVTVTGRGNYTGAVDVIYHIDPAVVASAVLDKTQFTYNQKVQRSKVKEVKSENGLVLTSDEYTVKYTTPKSTNAGTYKLTVTGKGNFAGSVEKRYKIAKAEITSVTLNKTEYTYNGKVQRSSIKSVKAGDLILTKDDYSAVWFNSKSTDAGSYLITVKGKGNYTGTQESSYWIRPVKLSYVAVDKTKYTYNKKAQRPLVTKVKAGDFTLKKTEYSVTYSKKNSISVGRYTLTVQSKSPNYEGTVDKTYQINPLGTSITALTAGSKSAIVVWKKQTTKMSQTTITGYQIQASLTKDFSTIAAKATVKGAAQSSGKLTGLKAKKVYYVRIRTYKTIGKNTYYSGWKVFEKTVKAK